MSTEIGRLGGYGYRGTVTAGDRFNQQGGGNGIRLCEPAKKKDKAVEEGGTQRGRI